MERLNQTWVDTVAYHFSGAKRAKFLASVRILNESIAQGAWVKRGSVKADSGFYQGLCRSKERHPNHEVDMCLSFGRPLSDARLREFADKLTPVELAWARLCTQKAKLAKELDASRPAPVVTAIGLSPKVTKTLVECNLDLDLPTIKMAKIDFKWVPASKFVKTTDGKLKFEPLFDRDGNRVMEKHYFVAWTPGIKHQMSRFAGGGCEACGKTIPSGRFVPIEATCKRNGLISMWIGCDCAKNIFGIKDVGLARDEKPTAGV